MQSISSNYGLNLHKDKLSEKLHYDSRQCLTIRGAVAIFSTTALPTNEASKRELVTQSYGTDK